MPDPSHAPYDRADYWDGVARRVVERGADPELAGNAGPFHRYRRQISETRLFDLLPVEGLSVLEVGCGPGGNLSVLAQRHPRRLVGADVSPAMVELARSRGVAEIFHVEGDMLPFGDQELDSTLTHTGPAPSGGPSPAAADDPVRGEYMLPAGTDYVRLDDATIAQLARRPNA